MGSGIESRPEKVNKSIYSEIFTTRSTFLIVPLVNSFGILISIFLGSISTNSDLFSKKI